MITLLVPTKDRSAFVHRLLRYYRLVGLTWPLWILDSSEDEHREQNERSVAAQAERLTLRHVTLPGMHNAACMHAVLPEVATPYAVLLPDDDFLIPQGLASCTAFLETHPHFVAGHGEGWLFALDRPGAHGRVTGTVPYPQPAREEATAAARLRAHFAAYRVTLFSVHRTTALRAMYEHVPLLDDAAFALELLPCALSVVLGKIKALDGPYLLRQTHAQRHLLSGMFEWMIGDRFVPSYLTFERLVAEAVALRDGTGADQARAIVREAFHRYLAEGLTLHWRERYGRPGQGFPRTARWTRGLLRRLVPPPADLRRVRGVLAEVLPESSDSR